MAFQTVKTTVITKSYQRNLEVTRFLILDCGCDLEGSTNLICNKKNGQCACKPNVGSRQCDKCQDGYKLHPNCISRFSDLFVIMQSNNYVF